jgi:MFS family permease
MNQPNGDKTEHAEPGARLALAVLVVVYVFNFLDRQILSILAERIKADLHVTDAQMGYLYGTVFAVFFAVFGIPLGRLADVWDRRRLISWGLLGWSAMTALSGLARSFPHLALARVGVGVGEASASPAAYSMLSDLFPRARRATALAIYSSGIYIGSGLGLGIGGLIVDRWDRRFDPMLAGALGDAAHAAPFGLKGWQVAFLAVGIPGMLLALVVRRLREPARGRFEGGPPAALEPRPFAVFFTELMAVLPPFTFFTLARERAPRLLAANLAWAAACAAAAWSLISWLGNAPQWIALAVGTYGAASWAQRLKLRDRPTHELIFRSPSLQAANFGIALQAFNTYAFGFWTAPFLIRTHGAQLSDVGFILGGIAALCGWIGSSFGGVLADRWQKRSPRGRLYVTMVSAVGAIPCGLALLAAPNLTWAYLACIPLYLISSLWLGPGAALVQDGVLPRMRAVASANYLLIVTFVGLAMGPYTVGRLSGALGGLKPALAWALLANIAAFTALLVAAKFLVRDHETKEARAAAAGAA